MMTMREILRFSNLSLTYQAENGEVEALKNINFVVNEGELVSIIGPSGCGKTSLLSLISGIVSPTSGQIIGDSFNNIGYMLQKDNLLEWRTIRSNVLLGLEIRKNIQNADYANHLLKTYGLWEFRDKYPSQLSGGMRQRVALIRTLATKPELLLLDEAFSALDYQTRLVVVDDVFSILRKEKKTAIIVTHDITEGISMSDRVILFSKRPGQIRHNINLEFPSNLLPLQRREEPNFRKYFTLIWKELDVNV